MSNFDCLYLYYVIRCVFHFLNWFVFKQFCFENIQSDTHVQYPCNNFGWFVLFEGSCSVITFSLTAFMSESFNLNNQFEGVEDQYNNM